MRSKKRLVLIIGLVLLGLSRMMAAYGLVPVNRYKIFLGPMAQVFSVPYRFTQTKVESIFENGEVDTREIKPGRKVNGTLNLGYFSRHAMAALIAVSHVKINNAGFDKFMKMYFCQPPQKARAKEVNFYSRPSELVDYTFKSKLDCGGL